MTKEGKNIRLSLFGFNKNEVDKYINNLEKQKINQLEELKESIAMITSENKMWERELEELKEMLDNQLKQQDFMQYALNKAETEIKPLIMTTVKNKNDSISVIKGIYESDNNVVINDLNEISEVNVCKLENDVLSNSEENDIISQEILLEDMRKNMQENISDKEELENSTLKIATVEEEKSFENISDKLESDFLHTNVLEREQHFNMSEEENASENSEYIEDIAKDVPEIQEEVINENSHVLIEEDNSELNLPNISVKISNENNNEAKSLTNFWEEENDIEACKSFWDEDFEEFSEFEKVEELSEIKKKLELKEIPLEETIEKLVEKEHLLEKSMEDKDNSMDNIGFGFCNRNDDKENKTKKYDDEKINTSNIFLENKPVESKAVTSEIKNIRSKYLIGKIVGEDLMDKKGRLLAKKGSTITEDLIEIIDKEGKLAELILNMVLPETSE